MDLVGRKCVRREAWGREVERRLRAALVLFFFRQCNIKNVRPALPPRSPSPSQSPTNLANPLDEDTWTDGAAGNLGRKGGVLGGGGELVVLGVVVLGGSYTARGEKAGPLLRSSSFDLHHVEHRPLSESLHFLATLQSRSLSHAFRTALRPVFTLHTKPYLLAPAPSCPRSSGLLRSRATGGPDLA